MEKKCDACEFLKSPDQKHQVLVTDSWNVGISNDQPYLGRAYATLRTHKGKISELSTGEWQEFHQVIAKLEVAYGNAFGAEVLNIECNMNHAFKTEPFNPHVVNLPSSRTQPSDVSVVSLGFWRKLVVTS